MKITQSFEVSSDGVTRTELEQALKSMPANANITVQPVLGGAEIVGAWETTGTPKQQLVPRPVSARGLTTTGKLIDQTHSEVH